MSTCVVLEKKKTYLYDRWGTTYEDSAWTNEKLEEVVYSSKYYFEEEKEYYSKVDHVICLTNYMKEVLFREYDKSYDGSRTI